jgi:hypothetical protein
MEVVAVVLVVAGERRMTRMNVCLPVALWLWPGACAELQADVRKCNSVIKNIQTTKSNSSKL